MMSHFRIARFLVLQLIKFINADTAFYTLFKAIFSFIPGLVRNVGIIPVASGVLSLYSFLKKGLLLQKFPTEVLDKLNPVVVKTLMEAISPHWNTCIKNTALFKNIFRVFLGFFSMGLIRPVIFKSIQYSVGIIFTSLGIAWNEALSTISFLKTISDYVLTIIPIKPLFENFLNFATPDSIVDKKIIKDSLKDNSSWFSIVGILILGAGTILTMMFIGDYFISSTIRSIPGVANILDPIYSIGNYFLSWFQSTPIPKPETDTLDSSKINDALNSVSRSTSSSSGSSTVTPSTPPATRPGTPIVDVWPEPSTPAPSQSPWG